MKFGFSGAYKYEIYENLHGETIKTFDTKEQMKMYLTLTGFQIGKRLKKRISFNSYELI